jgi:cyclopropane-fatty-acyl-phospholipid synthase
MKPLRLFSLEHSRAAYLADFAFYAGAVLALAASLLVGCPRAQWLEMAGLTLAGLASWSAIEYALHRFVLHGLQPFKSWHAVHHQRPIALICTPTALSASLLALLVFLPALLLGSLWRACAVLLGVLAGYLVYTVTHHATHHWRGESAWLLRRKQWHAQHHHRSAQPGFFGVTSSFWDGIFGSGR